MHCSAASCVDANMSSEHRLCKQMHACVCGPQPHGKSMTRSSRASGALIITVVQILEPKEVWLLPPCLVEVSHCRRHSSIPHHSNSTAAEPLGARTTASSLKTNVINSSTWRYKHTLQNAPLFSELCYRYVTELGRSSRCTGTLD